MFRNNVLWRRRRRSAATLPPPPPPSLPQTGKGEFITSKVRFSVTSEVNTQTKPPPIIASIFAAHTHTSSSHARVHAGLTVPECCVGAFFPCLSHVRKADITEARSTSADLGAAERAAQQQGSFVWLCLRPDLRSAAWPNTHTSLRQQPFVPQHRPDLHMDHTHAHKPGG